MENKKNIFNYVGQVLCVFAITMIIMMFFSILFGEKVKGISSMFALGSLGIPISTMFQFLWISILIVLEVWIFFPEGFIKKMSVAIRYILMLISIIVTISIFIYYFKWFPIYMWKAWAMFILCFVICTIISIVVMVVKKNVDNKKMEKALIKIQEQWRNE